ncbi:MAG TPA: hypothetical protein VHH36_07595, partial [Candidatus Thermoplasmatota archaeon]|nr:hypothetical protein [Candidatus Thermoplasmatota archaeon]
MAVRLRRAPLVAALALAALFGLVAALVAAGATAGLDARVDAATRAPASAVVWGAWALDAAGSAWAVGAFVGGAALAMLARGLRREAFLLGGAAVAEEALVQGLKLLAGRARPDGGLVEALGASFPSGHAARAALLATLGVAFAW